MDIQELKERCVGKKYPAYWSNTSKERDESGRYLHRVLDVIPYQGSLSFIACIFELHSLTPSGSITMSIDRVDLNHFLDKMEKQNGLG